MNGFVRGERVRHRCRVEGRVRRRVGRDLREVAADVGERSVSSTPVPWRRPATVGVDRGPSKVSRTVSAGEPGRLGREFGAPRARPREGRRRRRTSRARPRSSRRTLPSAGRRRAWSGSRAEVVEGDLGGPVRGARDRVLVVEVEEQDPRLAHGDRVRDEDGSERRAGVAGGAPGAPVARSGAQARTDASGGVASRTRRPRASANQEREQASGTHRRQGIALGLNAAAGVEWRPVNRFQKLAALTLATALGLVTIGVIVRATDSGLGCPDWPLCHGQLIPPLDDTKAWIEWVHRTVAVIIGFEILGLALLALRDHRDRRSILWPSFAAVGLVGFQAWLGRETVRLGNSGESVTAHLAAALALVGLLVFLTVRAGYPARIGGRGASQRFTLLAAFTTAATFALLLFGSQVTATSSALVFPDWPLMNGSLLPALTDVTAAHVLHRWVAALVGLFVVDPGGRGVADPARPPDARPAGRRFGGPVRDPGRDRWRPGPDAARRVDADAAPGARRGDLGDARRVDGHELLHGPGERAGDAAGAGETAGAGPDGTGGSANQGRHDPRLHRPDQAPDHRAAARHDGPRDGPRHARPARRRRPGSTGPTGSRSSSGR